MKVSEAKHIINNAKGITFSFYTREKWYRAFIAQANIKIGMTIHDLDEPKPDNKNFLYCWHFDSSRGGYDSILERAAIFIETVIKDDYKTSRDAYKLSIIGKGQSFSSDDYCPFS